MIIRVSGCIEGIRGVGKGSRESRCDHVSMGGARIESRALTGSRARGSSHLVCSEGIQLVQQLHARCLLVLEARHRDLVLITTAQPARHTIPHLNVIEPPFDILLSQGQAIKHKCIQDVLIGACPLAPEPTGRWPWERELRVRSSRKWCAHDRAVVWVVPEVAEPRSSGSEYLQINPKGYPAPFRMEGTIQGYRHTSQGIGSANPVKSIPHSIGMSAMVIVHRKPY